MDVLQGRYLKELNSKGGKLKGLVIETETGIQTVRLPKPLREIAQQELTVGDALRVWGTPDKKKGHKKGKKGRKKGKKGAKSAATLVAVQLIPMKPAAKVSAAKVKRKQKKRKQKSVKVQLCQKKNCCKKGGTELWQTFEQANQAASAENSAKAPFKLEAVGCLGGCKRGPNLRFLPDNVKHYHVQPGDVERLLQRHGA